MRAYGINKQKEVSIDEINRVADDFNLKTEDVYVLDSRYYKYLFSLDTAEYKYSIKNHYQPLQVSYYDLSSDKLISFFVNCYVRGFPNLKWNRTGGFNSFLPETQAELDSILPLEVYLNYLNNPNSNSKINYGELDYLVLVQWSIYMGRQSEKLIDIVNENIINYANPKKVKVIYVNNDNALIHLSKTKNDSI